MLSFNNVSESNGDRVASQAWMDTHESQDLRTILALSLSFIYRMFVYFILFQPPDIILSPCPRIDYLSSRPIEYCPYPKTLNNFSSCSVRMRLIMI